MRRGTLSAAVVAAAMLAVTGSAQAKVQPRSLGVFPAGAKPVQVGSPGQVGTPAVMEDNNGNALIAWADTSTSPNTVQYCVVTNGTNTCAHQGTLTPSAAQNIDNVQVLYEGPGDSPTYVILADAYAATGDNPGQFSPEQEWQSTDRGATWVLQAQGQLIADGILGADTVPVNAVNVPAPGEQDGSELGYGWDTASGVPTFQAFPLRNPPACAAINEPLPCDGGSFATLEPNSNPDTLGNAPGHFGWQYGDTPGVLGVFDTNFTSGPLGCPDHFGTAFVYGSGLESPTNDYNISPGQPGSAWKNALTQADCNTEYSTAAGGPSGFGILEENLNSRSVVYHAFSTAADGFKSAPVTVNATSGDFEPSLNQDSDGGIYAVYFAGSSGSPIDLSYSGTQGASFATAQLDPDSDGMEDNLASAVNPVVGTLGYAVWTDGNAVYELPFEPSTVLPPASVGSTATATTTTVTVTVTCSSPCTVQVSVTVSTGALSSLVSGAHGARSKTVSLGRGRVTVHQHGRGHLKLHLSSKARRLLRGKHGSVRVNATIKTKIQGVTVTRHKRLRLKLR